VILLWRLSLTLFALVVVIVVVVVAVLTGELFTDQFVVVQLTGPEDAPNLFASLGSPVSAASNQCCLGKVDQLLLANGNTVTTLPFSSQLVKKRASTADSFKGKKDRTEEEKQEEAAPSIRKVKVMWFGDAKQGTCKLTGVMKELGVHDVVPRELLFFEEASPGSIRMKNDGCLYRKSLETILAAAPDAVSSSMPASNSTSPKWSRSSEPQPITGTTNHNHAGFLVSNEPPLPDEEHQWEATLLEIKGFEWKEEDPLGADPALVFEVIDIRRWRQNLWAIVKTSNGDVQADHMFDDVRARMFSRMVESVPRCRGRQGVPPLMLSWQRFQESAMIIDIRVVAQNLEYFFKYEKDVAVTTG
jgi:hypothetical protein